MARSSLRYRVATQRQEWITLALRTTGFLSVGDISREFGVSHMTVRRDLQELRRTGQVRTVHGGVVSSATSDSSSPWARASCTAHVCIGRRAATLVGETDAIAIDAGRLAYEVARALPERFRGTVVTHSLPVIQLLAGRPRPPRVVGLGGELMADRSALAGATTLAAIAGVRVQTLFLVADAVDKRGAYTRLDSEASVKRALLNIADRTVLLANRNGFVEAAPFRLGTLAEFSTLITDQFPSEKFDGALRQAGVRTLIAQGRVQSAAPENGGGYRASR